MNLIKTSWLSLISTTVKLLAGLIINKAIAIFIGPTGLATIGQLQNFIQVAMTFSKGGINSGVTKYIAEYSGDSTKIKMHVSTAFKITVVCSIFVCLFCLFFSNHLSYSVFHSNDFGYIFILFGVNIFMFSFNQLLLSILNGLKLISNFIFINIVQSVVSLFYTSGLIYLWGLDGALVALVTNQSFVLFFFIWILKSNKIIRLDSFLKKFSNQEAKKLYGYALMALTTAITVPVSQLIIRNKIILEIGWQEAGYWQGIMYISNMYLLIIMTVLSTYYLPRLSELREASSIRGEIIKGYKLLIPFALAMFSIIFLIKNFIVLILFSEEFYGMGELFKWQLIGDFVRVCSLLLSYILLAKAMKKPYILTELIFSITFVILSYILIDYFNVLGVTIAYTISYLLYFIIVLYSTRKVWL